MIEKSPFSKVDHIGVIVRDMDAAIRHYQSLGIGPFEPLNLVSTERWVLGKPVAPDSIKLKVRCVKMGSVNLELIEPGEGESLWKEYLATKGEGINHLAFLVDNIDREIAKMKATGIKVLYSSRFKNGGGAAYFDTGRIGNVLIELVQWPPE